MVRRRKVVGFAAALPRCQVPKNGGIRRKFNIQIWLSKSGHLVKIGFARQILVKTWTLARKEPAEIAPP